MIGVSFNGYHSYDDFGMVLTDAEIGLPDPVTDYITIPGRSGTLDLSEALSGEIVYGDRKLSMTFATSSNRTGVAWASFLSTLSGALHGQKIKIAFDDDPDNYYTGRCTIDSHETDRIHSTVKITATCDPYKYKTDSTTVTASLTTTAKTITLSNSRKPVVPSITVTAQTTLTFNGSTYTVNAGTHKIPGIRLVSGTNKLTAKTVSDTGTITITYQEGSL